MEQKKYTSDKGVMDLRIALRPYRENDWQAVYAWVKDPAIKDNFRFTQRELSEEDMRKFVQSQIENEDSSDISFVLYDLNDPEKSYIGSVSLKHIDEQDRNAELAIVVSKETYRGKGYGQEALYLICEYGFRERGLHKVYLTCVSHNTGAIRSYEKFGFLHEGLRKEQVFQHGQFHDEVMMGILKQDFNNKYKTTL